MVGEGWAAPPLDESLLDKAERCQAQLQRQPNTRLCLTPIFNENTSNYNRERAVRIAPGNVQEMDKRARTEEDNNNLPQDILD